MKTFQYTLFIALVTCCLILISIFRFDTISILTVVLACFLAIVFPYLDFMLRAFYVVPKLENSVTIRGLFLRKEFSKLINFIDTNRFIDNKSTISSAHFQVVLVFLGFYFLTTLPSLFGFSFLLSLMFNLIYRLYTSFPFYQGWFWFFKNPVSVTFVKVWLVVHLTIAFIYVFLI